MNMELSQPKQFKFERHSDQRGFFSRCWSESAMRGIGGLPEASEVSFSWNPEAYTLRGMHLLKHPCQEQKAVFVVQGKIQDVQIDVRAGSETAYKHSSVILEAGNGVLIPPQFAHGFLTLEPNTQLLYIMSSPYYPESEAAINFADPKIGISWVAEPRVISMRDANHPLIL